MRKLFEDIVVLDLTTNAAGPVASAMLADFGAEVLKVEKPGVGDDTRGFPPFLDDQIGVTFLYLNRGKKSIVIDITTPKGLEIVKKIANTADIILENYRPGTLKKFGLDYESIKQSNPKVIMCSISGYGQTGPDSAKPGYDLIAQAYSGMADLTGLVGGPPVRSGLVMGDYVSGNSAFSALSAALYYREKTGIGQYIDISLVDCLVSMNSQIEVVALGRDPRRQGNHHSMLCPFGLFSAKNGAVVICAPNPKLWRNLCLAMDKVELIDDPVFSTGPQRIKNIDKVVDVISNWLSGFANLDEAITKMTQHGVPCEKVQTTKELTESKQLESREMIIDLEMPLGMKTRTIKARGNQLKFSAVHAELKRPPNLGEHTQEILAKLGYVPAEIEQLINEWSVMSR